MSPDRLATALNGLSLPGQFTRIKNAEAVSWEYQSDLRADEADAVGDDTFETCSEVRKALHKYLPDGWSMEEPRFVDDEARFEISRDPVKV